METNLLYYGDNLEILRKYVPEESVDLVYLDPPFNSNQTYNVIFKDESGVGTDAQLVAFEDTWHWGPSAEQLYAYLTNTGRHKGRVPSAVSSLIAALRAGIGANQMTAYVVEMAVRLVELQRVLKPTGTLYLHCDPTASHYLKVILDATFGPDHFSNEIIWKRTNARSTDQRWPRLHDVLLVYGKGERLTFNPVWVKADKAKMPHTLITVGGKKYQTFELTAPGATKVGDSGKPWRGFDPTTMGRHWANTHKVMDDWNAKGLIHWPKAGVAGGFPRRRDDVPFDEDARQTLVGDVWTDIDRINQAAKERLGYPTQKPVALLERILTASSNPGDVVLDPFCGCGTALVAAQKLGRKWVGIDVTYLAIAVMRARLKDHFGLTVSVVGQPTEVEGARQLAQSPEGRYQFQWWALALVDATPIGGVEKKGSDRGIDGIITFTGYQGKLETVLVSVKSGGVHSTMVRDLKGTMDREKAPLGLLITLEEPSKEMQREADTAGLFRSEVWKRDYPRIQILTIKELLEEHKKPALPPFVMPTYQQAQRIDIELREQGDLFEPEPIESGEAHRRRPGTQPAPDDQASA